MPLPPVLLRTLDRLRPLGARLRRPTGRALWRGTLGLGMTFVAYVLVLIPFTPGIGDIRKAKVDEPARVVSAWWAMPRNMWRASAVRISWISIWVARHPRW